MKAKMVSAADRLEVVGELASLINTTFDLDEIFSTAILKIQRVLEFRRASVVLVTDDRSNYYLHTLYDVEGGGFVREVGTNYPVDQGLTGRVIQSGVAIRIDDFGGTSGIRTKVEESVSALIVPLRVDEQVIGTLNLGAAASATYTDEDLELAVLLARQIETSLYYSKLLATIQMQREALAVEHERVASERTRLEALIEASNAAILMVSGDRVAHANQAMAELLVLPREVLVGSSLEMINRVLMRSLVDPGVLTAQIDALERGDTHVRDRIEFQFPRKLICERTVETVRATDGEVLGHLIMYRDVTREAEAEAAKSEFVSIVSHELRTPLTSIKTSLSLLTKGAAGVLSEQMAGLLEIALRNLERLIRLVDDLLDLSRIESGRMLGALAPLSLTKALQGAIEAVRDYAQERGVRIEWTRSDDDDDDLLVMGDEDRLQQVIVNLLSNAIKFSPAKGRVGMALKKEPSSVLLEISDEGPGIPGGELETIFDKFRQLERSQTRKHGGAGLGLAISRTIVEQFGGELWAESEEGRGSRFFVRLRIAQGRAARRGSEAQGESGPPPQRILIVETESALRRRLIDSFEEDGWEVVAVTAGRAGLDSAANCSPAVIAVGVELDDMHGLEFLQQLRQSPATADTPALLVGLSGDSGQAVSYGADGTVAANPQALLVEMKRLVGAPRRHLVLLIEDDPAVRTGLSRGLRRAGFACLEAASGESGLDFARERVPDVLVTDLRIPGKDGLALLREMRAEPGLADVPAIVVTGHAESGAAEAIEQLNAHLLPKPFSLAVIVREIDRLLESGGSAG
ncbi:MAG: response regulator [Gemmatimonadota bacterium]